MVYTGIYFSNTPYMNRKNWNAYIERQKPAYRVNPFSPEFAADMVVVIPCYNEPNLFTTLHSLLEVASPEAKIATVIVFNSSERSTEEGIMQNRSSFKQVGEFAAINNSDQRQFLPLLFEGLPRKHAGVGLARKIGMDLAVEHFFLHDKADGVIVSLDADCTVSENFLTEIYHAFSSNGRLNATVHHFHHRVEENSPKLERAVRQYENYIRYYRAMLRFTGFPWYFHTIGSAFAVKADAYVRVGGMGRQQGGEDFYFLQKVFSLEGTAELHELCVCPLARYSDRVPFGTGPALQKMLNETDDELRVYSPDAFVILKQLFDRKDAFFKKDAKRVEEVMAELHPALQRFLDDLNFLDDIADCNNNSASPAAFRKRFFHHFSAFRIVKFLNYVHPDPFPFVKISSVTDKC